MNDCSDHSRPDASCCSRPSAPGERHWRHLWPWAFAGLSVTLALCVIAIEVRRLTGTASASATAANGEWWQSSALLAALMAGMVLTATAVVLVQQRLSQRDDREEGRRELRGIAQALAEMAHDPRSAWRALRENNVIDGHALWDADGRLVDFSGFLGRHIPHLADWREPSVRQLTSALVDGGHLTLPPGLDRDQTVEVYCTLHDQVPGLREMRMSDGQTYMARTADLGEGRLATIYTNITELQHPRADLLRSDAFRQVFDQAPAAKLLLDADLRPRAANRAFAALLGHSLDAVARLGWRGLLHPEEASDTAPWSAGIHRLVNAQGETVRVTLAAQRLENEHGAESGRLLVTLNDVTARWEAEEQQRLNSTVLDRLAVAVLAVDRGGRIAYGNQAARLLFQWSSTILPGTAVERLLGSAVRAALDDDTAELETEGTTWNGTAFPAQVALTRLDDAGPLAGGSILIVTDLTPRRALDLQLMHSARLATLGEMAASIAHEFNQCLHVIRLSSEAVQLDIADKRIDSERLAKRAENILGQVDRLTEMVTHMRAISRRENHDKQPFSPQAAVESALRMVEPLLKADGIRVVRQCGVEGLAVLGHQVRLEQVLLNLLNNGRDAIRDRFRRQGNTGGTLTITGDTYATLGGQQRLRIAVRDDGTGIATGVGEHIFEPFVTTKDGGNGLGLGLSISRGICTEMGGSLTFGNVEGGAEFVIDLPVATGAECTAAAHESASAADHAPCWTDDGTDGADDEDLRDERRILLVDDEALSVLMVAEFLNRQGYVVDTAYDGLEAYELCRTHVYHAVVTDIRMPRMTGRELIVKLAELQPGTPVIVVTGHLKESNAADLGNNVVALLAKPFQLQDLREQLLRLDRVHEERQEEGV